MDRCPPPPADEPTEQPVPRPAPSAGPAGPVEVALVPHGEHRGEQPPLRADAARNRARLLDAAARLVTRDGVEGLTMEAVAAAAQVGKGTVFRRFGDRIGLLHALLEHREEQLQHAFMAGPPPLGPDASAVERLHAFGPAVIRHEHLYGDLYLACRADPVRTYTVPAHHLRLAHVAMLLRAAGAGGDIELLSQALLGFLDPGLVDHLLTRRRLPVDRLEAGWHDLVDRVVRPAGA